MYIESAFGDTDGMFMETKGQRIRDCMRKSGISQQQLAKRLGVYPSAVQKWLADDNQPTDEYLIAMAEIFGVEPTWLDWGKFVLTDQTEEIARQFATLSQRDQNIVANVVNGLVTDNKKDTDDKNNVGCC